MKNIKQILKIFLDMNCKKVYHTYDQNSIYGHREEKNCGKKFYGTRKRKYQKKLAGSLQAELDTVRLQENEC